MDILVLLCLQFPAVESPVDCITEFDPVFLFLSPPMTHALRKSRRRRELNEGRPSMHAPILLRYRLILLKRINDTKLRTIA